MTLTIDYYTHAVGKIIIRNKITTRRGTRTTISSDPTENASGFVISGVVEYELLANIPNPENPLIVSVGHIIPSFNAIQARLGRSSTLVSMDTEYWFKVYDPYYFYNLYKFYKLKLICYNRSVDLSLFSFHPDTPFDGKLALQWSMNTVKSGMDCYLIGYPLGDSQFSITNGVVRDPTYCFQNFEFGIDQLYHSAPAAEGNSGCCILDKDGYIIGVHGWSSAQNIKDANRNPTSNVVGYEVFTGGSSGKMAHRILSYMFQNQNLILPSKYYPRVFLGITGKILDDEFRIDNFTNPNIKNLDGMRIETILSTYTIDTYNRTANTKIEVGDIITYIQDKNGNFVQIGYLRDSPVNILFELSLTNPIQIKIRKATLSYATEFTLTLNSPKILPESLDSFYSRNI